MPSFCSVSKQKVELKWQSRAVFLDRIQRLHIFQPPTRSPTFGDRSEDTEIWLQTAEYPAIYVFLAQTGKRKMQQSSVISQNCTLGQSEGFWNVKFANSNIKLCQENTLFPTAVPQVLVINQLSARRLSDAAAYQRSVVAIKNVPEIDWIPSKKQTNGLGINGELWKLSRNSDKRAKLPTLRTLANCQNQLAAGRLLA